jgi:hypothetical protein
MGTALQQQLAVARVLQHAFEGATEEQGGSFHTLASAVAVSARSTPSRAVRAIHQGLAKRRAPDIGNPSV